MDAKVINKAKLIKVPQKITDNEINNIINDFRSGSSINNLVQSYGYTKTTIIKYLKKNINETDYKNLIVNSRLNNNKLRNKKLNNIYKDEDSQLSNFPTHFIELQPLNCEIDDSLQKDLSSIPLNEINFPKMVYLIVDKNVELKIKLLREYISWQFLPEEELNRKTIEIYFDIKIAKRYCLKDQKVIKVPNTDVFKIVAPLLLSRGISRIVSEEKLISL